MRRTNLIPTSIHLFALAILSLGISGCVGQEGGSNTKPMKPIFDRKKVDKGFVVFIAHCQRCHGLHAKGDERWYHAQDDETIPPPLNGNGSTWKLNHEQLTSIITNGAKDEEIMPGFGQTLASDDIQNVITWFQSIWPPQKYHAWKEINQNK